MNNKRNLSLLAALAALILAGLACQTLNSPTEEPAATLAPTNTPTPLPQPPDIAPEARANEPVYITGDIPYTSPFVEYMLYEPFVLLEDQAGFIARDEFFEFDPAAQVLGRVVKINDETLRYSVPLPAVPLGKMVDVDQDGSDDAGVQVFTVAFWSNTWGDGFIERRDGTGWSGSYVSTMVNSERDGEIEGGILVVWAPDDQQGFPTGFGEDDMLFTADDPTAPLPAGYSLVNLDQQPFEVYKEAQPEIPLYEGALEVKDYSEMDFVEAYDAMFERVSREYPFTADKQVDWDALNAKFRPQFEDALTLEDFYLLLVEFSQSVPDGHIGVSWDDTIAPQYFVDNYGGSFGLVLAELSNGKVIVTAVYQDTSGDQAGIEPGAEIITWEGQPVTTAIDQVKPFFGPYSTAHHLRQYQLMFLTRYPLRSRAEVTFQNPGDDVRSATLDAEYELDSLFDVLFPEDLLALPVEAEVLYPSGLGYIKINTFIDDLNLMARLYNRAIEGLIENGVQGLIIDVRNNGGGSGGLANDFAGYFVDEEMLVSRSAYFSDESGVFEFAEHPRSVLPADVYYEGDLAVLVGPECISACEIFAYMLQLSGRATVVGHFPSAGAFGEVGQGQYTMPGGFDMQFPTGRYETMDGDLLLEGVGVVPDITVPITEASAMGEVDAVLDAAIKALTQ